MNRDMTAREYAAANRCSLSTAYRRLKEAGRLLPDRKGAGKGRKPALDWRSDAVRGLAKQSTSGATFRDAVEEVTGVRVHLSTARRWRAKLFAEST